MDLICYLHPGWDPLIRPAEMTRAWMDASPEVFAYRCLPLNIANAHGWEMLSPCGFEASWNGGPLPGDVHIQLDAGADPAIAPVALFGQGVLTFHVYGLFRTEPGWNLWIGGSPNLPKDAIFPLTGIVETDWSPFTFTMNWRFTRPNTPVRFEAGEPFCFVFPIQRGYLEQTRPRLAPLESDPELMSDFKEWSRARNAFGAEVRRSPPKAPADKWQKHYFRGVDVGGRQHIPDHRTRLRVAPFAPHEPGTAPPSLAVQAPAPEKSPPSVAASGPPPSADEPSPGELNTLAETLRRSSLALRKRDWLLETIERHHALSDKTDRIERRVGLTREEFLDGYYARHRPVILSGEMADWPALSQWTPDHLRAVIGERTVEYQGDRDAHARYEPDKGAHRREASFGRFLDLLAASATGNDAYITAYNSHRNVEAFAPLQRDLGRLDKFLSHAPDRSAAMLWIGAGGSFTPLHHDLTNNFIAQICGRKRLKIIAAAEAGRLQNHEYVFSRIVDLDKTPLPAELGQTTIHDVVLNPGEIIFMPIGWWHQVRAIDFSITATYTNFIWKNDYHLEYPKA